MDSYFLLAYNLSINFVYFKIRGGLVSHTMLIFLKHSYSKINLEQYESKKSKETTC